jgi:hypothetical protein
LHFSLLGSYSVIGFIQAAGSGFDGGARHLPPHYAGKDRVVEEALKLQRPLPDAALTIVATAKKQDGIDA